MGGGIGVFYRYEKGRGGRGGVVRVSGQSPKVM
jgi:hypothetical protein